MSSVPGYTVDWRHLICLCWSRQWEPTILSCRLCLCPAVFAFGLQPSPLVAGNTLKGGVLHWIVQYYTFNYPKYKQWFLRATHLSTCIHLSSWYVIFSHSLVKKMLRFWSGLNKEALFWLILNCSDNIFFWYFKSQKKLILPWLHWLYVLLTADTLHVRWKFALCYSTNTICTCVCTLYLKWSEWSLWRLSLCL